MPLQHRIVYLQLAVTLIAAIVLRLVWSPEQALAALPGGFAGVLPGAYFAWRTTVERSPERLLAQGVVKIVLSFALLALGVVVFKPAPGGFFATFALVQAMYVIGPLVFRRAELPGR